MSLFTKLRQRNVFKVGAAYIVIAWLMLQVTDVVAPILELPSWVAKEGSVIRAGNTVRVSVRLIEGVTDRNLWNEHFDRELSDILSLYSKRGRTEVLDSRGSTPVYISY